VAQINMKTRLILGAILLMVAVAIAFGGPPSANESTSDAERAAAVEAMYLDYQSEFADVPDVDTADLVEWLNDPNTILVDVRKKKEREVSIIAGSITREEYESQADQYEGYRVVTYCTIGYRSGKYSERLRRDGTDAWNLAAGILGWVHAGEPVEIEGEPTLRVHVYGRQWSLLPTDYEPVW
jgi:rhodanese-related sulfurtransferase